MNKEEMPSEKKLAELREAGIVNYSYLCSRCFVLMAIFAFVLFGIDLEIFKLPTNIGDLRFKVDRYFELLLIPAILVFCVISLSILLQTKFLFRVRFVTPCMANVFRRKEAGLFSRILRAILSCFICAGFIYVIPYFLVQFYFELLHIMPNDSILVIIHYLKRYSLFILAFLFLFAILAWFLTKYLFLFKHRMSKKELENE